MSADELVAAIRFDERGLVPAIVQDAETLQVLMMAWMSAGVRQTLACGETVFWSRSRQDLWHRAPRVATHRLWLNCEWIVTVIHC